MAKDIFLTDQTRYVDYYWAKKNIQCMKWLQLFLTDYTRSLDLGQSEACFHVPQRFLLMVFSSHMLKGPFKWEGFSNPDVR